MLACPVQRALRTRMQSVVVCGAQAAWHPWLAVPGVVLERLGSHGPQQAQSGRMRVREPLWMMSWDGGRMSWAVEQIAVNLAVAGTDCPPGLWPGRRVLRPHRWRILRCYTTTASHSLPV